MRKASYARCLGRPLSDRRAARLVAHRSARLAPATSTRGQSPLAALAAAVDRHSADSLMATDGVGARALRSAVRALVADARAADPLRVERLVVTLRCVLRDLQPVGQPWDGEVRHALWRRIVKLCCEEFYGRRSAATGSAPLATLSA